MATDFHDSRNRDTPHESGSPRPPFRVTPALMLGLLAVAALPAYGIFEWFFCRIEVTQGRMAILIAKTGKDPAPGAVVAGADEMGVRLETLGEGRHFRNPFFWQWVDTKITEVPPGSVGVLTRLFGKEAEDGRILVEGGYEDQDVGKLEKGILREVLRPGRYRVNTLAYEVEVVPAVEVHAGHVGVVTSLVGKSPAKKNQYVVATGERGVQEKSWTPGTYYVNPYEVKVDPVSVRQRRLDFGNLTGMKKGDEGFAEAANDVIFPSSDGFDIDMKLSIMWNIDEENAPQTFVRLTQSGRAEAFEGEVVKKVLQPVVRGYARIEGSKFSATQYSSGEAREQFHKVLLDQIRTTCRPKGIIIDDVLVNDIEPPAAIAGPIRDREIAKEELARNKNQIEQAKAEQALARTEALKPQQRARVQGETKKIQAVIAAKQRKDVAEIEQEKLLTVAKTDFAASQSQSAAIISRGDADADVIRAQNAAAAEPLKRSVSAFRSPAEFAAYTLAKHLAPAIQGVFADPQGAFGRIFTEMLEPEKGVPPASAGTQPAKKEGN
jgi:hypothetical protein